MGRLLLGRIDGARRKNLRSGQEAPGERTGGRRDGTADDDPGNRTDHRAGHPGLRATDGELPAGARLLGLARPRGRGNIRPGASRGLGRISKMGQRDLRRLLITGAIAVVRHAVRRRETSDPWLAGMIARKPMMLVSVALANRTARIVWAVTTKKESYRAPTAT